MTPGLPRSDREVPINLPPPLTTEIKLANERTWRPLCVISNRINDVSVET